MRVGGVELTGGKIVNLVLDTIDYVPAFDSVDIGEFTLSTLDGVLRFNNGNNLVALNIGISENPNLKQSLGGNWLNPDLTFNPVPFNALDGIVGLNSNSSLFNVIDQITSLIENVGKITLSDIDMSDVVADDMTVVAYLAGDLILVSIEQVLEGSIISLDFDNLSGFDITDTTLGNMVIFNNSGNLVSKKFHYTYENLSNSVSHLIPHGLGKKYCSVSCINPATNQVSTPSSITFSTNDALVVNFTTSQPLVAFISNFEP